MLYETGEELLQFYGRLRGVPEAKLDALVTSLCMRLNLTDNGQHKVATGLS